MLHPCFKLLLRCDRAALFALRSLGADRESMPDTAAGAAAAAAGVATTAAEGAESSRHRHRAQQGDTERPEPGAAPPPAPSGVLGESCASFRSGRCGSISGHAERGQVDAD